MVNFDDNEYYHGVHQCFDYSQLFCCTGESASMYVPWSTTNATAIIGCIVGLSEHFAIYPPLGKI